MDTISLYAGERSDGSVVYEEVIVESLGDSRFRLAQSPGLVLGIAAGDIIEIDDQNRAKVVSRAGNLCIQIYTKGEGARIETILPQKLRALNARLDGKSGHQLVLTIPATAGFEAIESAMGAIVREFPEVEWFYGNVYDPHDGRTPLNWWLG